MSVKTKSTDHESGCSKILFPKRKDWLISGRLLKVWGFGAATARSAVAFLVVFSFLGLQTAFAADTVNSRAGESSLTGSQPLQETAQNPERSHYLNLARKAHARIKDPVFGIFKFDHETQVVWNQQNDRVLVKAEAEKSGIRFTFLMEVDPDDDSRTTVVLQKSFTATQHRFFKVTAEGAVLPLENEEQGCVECKRFWLQHFSFMQEVAEVGTSFIAGEPICDTVSKLFKHSNRSGFAGLMYLATKSNACAWVVRVGLQYSIHRTNMSFSEVLAERWCHEGMKKCQYKGFCTTQSPAAIETTEGLSRNLSIKVDKFGKTAHELTVAMTLRNPETGFTQPWKTIDVSKSLWIKSFRNKWVSEDGRLQLLLKPDDVLELVYQDPRSMKSLVTHELQCF